MFTDIRIARMPRQDAGDVAHAAVRLVDQVVGQAVGAAGPGGRDRCGDIDCLVGRMGSHDATIVVAA
jgi:hypothetical protein